MTIKTILILGAGIAGLPIAHYLAAHSTDLNLPLRIILVTPHDTFYWKLACVRFVMPGGGGIGEEEYMYPLREQFARYPKQKFELVIGLAEKLEPDQSTVRVRIRDDEQQGGGGGEEGEEEEEGEGEVRERIIEYHTLIIATGSRYPGNMPWKEGSSTEVTRENIRKIRTSIANAGSIVVAGAGATGVELAAELGHAYGAKGDKQITLLGADALPLSGKGIRPGVQKTAMKALRRLGVRYIGDVKVTGWNGSDRRVTLSVPDGSTRLLPADLLLPAYGSKPNISFAPERMRNAVNGYLRQDVDLRAPAYDNIFIVGDVGDLQPNQVVYAEAQVRHLMTQFDAYFARRPMKPYVFDPTKVQMAISLGPQAGTGQAGSWQIWGFLVRYLKSRYLGTNQAPAYARGEAGGLGKAWPK
ncbi:putative FAD binding protein [Poronia punctata]|nr:putative FAD binding protein [Poronia punctata]